MLKGYFSKCLHPLKNNKYVKKLISFYEGYLRPVIKFYVFCRLTYLFGYVCWSGYQWCFKSLDFFCFTWFINEMTPGDISNNQNKPKDMALIKADKSCRPRPFIAKDVELNASSSKTIIPAQNPLLKMSQTNINQNNHWLTRLKDTAELLKEHPKDLGYTLLPEKTILDKYLSSALSISLIEESDHKKFINLLCLEKIDLKQFEDLCKTNRFYLTEDLEKYLNKVLIQHKLLVGLEESMTVDAPTLLIKELGQVISEYSPLHSNINNDTLLLEFLFKYEILSKNNIIKELEPFKKSIHGGLSLKDRDILRKVIKWEAQGEIISSDYYLKLLEFFPRNGEQLSTLLRERSPSPKIETVLKPINLDSAFENLDVRNWHVQAMGKCQLLLTNLLRDYQDSERMNSEDVTLRQRKDMRNFFNSYSWNELNLKLVLLQAEECFGEFTYRDVKSSDEFKLIVALDYFSFKLEKIKELKPQDLINLQNEIYYLLPDLTFLREPKSQSLDLITKIAEDLNLSKISDHEKLQTAEPLNIRKLIKHNHRLSESDLPSTLYLNKEGQVNTTATPDNSDISKSSSPKTKRRSFLSFFY